MIPTGRVLGLDLGSRRIGVAVTDSDQRLATGVRTLTRSGNRITEHREVEALVEEYGAVGVVVGLPVSMSGQIGVAASGVLDEVGELRTALTVEVDTVDERLTTVAAAASLRAAGTGSRSHRTVIDQTAAAVLLQTWVDRRRNSGESSRESSN